MVERTSVSLLERLRDVSNDEAWARFCSIYGPLIRGWLVRRGVNQTDADDVQQDVLHLVAEKLPEFQHNGNTGALRCWLRNVVANRLTVFWRQKNKLGQGAGSAQIGEIAEQLVDPDSHLSRLWDQEYSRRLCERLLELAQDDFKPQTMAAFRRVFLEEGETSLVADELGMTANAVRIAQSRVLRRLRELSEGLLDE